MEYYKMEYAVKKKGEGVASHLVLLLEIWTTGSFTQVAL